MLAKYYFKKVTFFFELLKHIKMEQEAMEVLELIKKDDLESLLKYKKNGFKRNDN